MRLRGEPTISQGRPDRRLATLFDGHRFSVEGTELVTTEDDRQHVEDRIASMDWAKTSLGPMSEWPHGLRTVLRLMLSSRYAMWMGWGPDLVFFCNDTYREQTLGAKYPWALGRPAAEVWSEIWHILEPRIHHVLTTGDATYDEGLLLFLERSGYPEETYHSFSYSALPAEAAGQVGGLFCVVVEETERVIGERRIVFLGQLASLLSVATGVDDVFAALRESFARDSRDLPFTLTYLFDEEKPVARLILTTGFEAEHQHLAPETIDLESSAIWPLGAAVAGPHFVELSAGESWPLGPWKRPASRALLVPFARQGEARPAGVFVAGLNPHRPADEKASDFVRLLVGQLAAALANANANEAARRRAEALAEIDRAKTTFFSNVSHEFRTPLTLMLGPTEEALRAEHPVIEGEDVSLLHRNELRLLKLVNTLLDFARLESGRTEAHFVETDLELLTRGLANAFEYAIETAGLSFVVECRAIGAPVYVDRDMWEKIVLNLLSNALKFTFEGTIALRLHRRGDHAVLEVSDTGTGIPAAQLPRVFERFHRVVGGRSRTHEGSGIGLALVQELVRMHGGRIEAESTEGVGTTFRVFMRLGRAHLPTAETVAEAPAPGSARLAATPYVQEALRWLPRAADRDPEKTDGTEIAVESHARPGEPRSRVLVADDNADMRDYICRLLGEHWDVEAACDGAEALAAIRRRKPDLVVSDVMMPVIDGVQLLREIRNDPGLAELQVILLSARAGEEATAQGLAVGADDYLVKPFSARELLVRVTARLNVARTRAVERRRILRLLEQVPAVVNFLRGPDLVLEYEHPLTAKALHGRPVLGKKLLDALPELASQPYHERLKRVYETGQPFSQREAEVRLIIEGKEVVSYWSSDYLPILDEAGRVEGVMTFDLNVTDQVTASRRIEAARAEAEKERQNMYRQAEKYRALVLAVGNIVWTNAPDGTMRGPQPGWCAYTGQSEEDVQGYGWSKALHPDDVKPTIDAWEQAVATRTMFVFEHRVRGKDGAYRWFYARAVPVFTADGGVQEWVGLHRDIQGEKELGERERAARIEAEEASHAKDDFLAMLGHELRNPLAPITTAVHLLKLRGNEGIEREVSVIERQAEHIARLVDDLLDVSRIARGKVLLTKEPAEIADLVAAAVETASPAIEQGHHTLALDVPRSGLVVDVDRVRMTQVLSNLLTNAAKYTEPGGKIRVVCARDGDAVVIEVIDTGTGMPSELLPRVFDLFVQSRQTLDRSQGGLGLGLAIVKNIVVMHGGSVSAHSEGEGRGSTFTVRLPLAPVVAQRTESQRPAPARSHGNAPQHRVLIVDDNSDGAFMLAEALELQGYETATAEDGPNALDRAASFSPDIALLDIGLPVMDGYELAGRLREQRRDVKLVAITGYGQESDREQTRRAGFQAHMTKPIDLQDLSRLLANLLREDSGRLEHAANRT